MPTASYTELIDATLNGRSASFASIARAADAIHEDDLFNAVEILKGMLCDDTDDSRCLRVAVMLGAVLHRYIFEKRGVERHPDACL